MDTNLSLPFPPVPAGADKSILKPSAVFNQNVYRSIGAVILFIITYIVLLLFVIGLAFAFGAFGVLVMEAKLGFLTLALGIALIGSGLLLVYFIIKFLFKRSVTDYSGMIEIYREDQPQLYNFIEQLTTEAAAPFPKRIFISADVNAGVFYDSNFWSMFFPVKKNLKIGLGLVNTINVSEFKAVMAHEFGHFSQRSMKFGSYVYNMNRVIYNLLYDNEGYGKLLNSMSKLHSLFYLTASINLWVIKGIQYVLRKVYVVLNTTHLALARQMEFHADAMAAYVSGSNNAISSLKRIEIGQVCYNELLGYWNGQLAKNKRADNFYPQHMELMKLYAVKNGLEQDAFGLPVITKGLDIANTSQVVVNDQWSSHPSDEDREASLLKINLNAASVPEPAWVLFNNAEDLQILLTNDVYVNTAATIKTERISLVEFKADLLKDVNDYSLDKVYNGYYDSRFIKRFDVDEAIAASKTAAIFKIDELLSSRNTQLPVVVERLQRDYNTLEAVWEVRKDIKSFDYKGIKHKRKSAPQFMELLEQERRETTKQIEELDKQIFMYFYHIADNDIDRDALAGKYKRLFEMQADSSKDYNLLSDVIGYVNNFYDNMPFEQAKNNVAKVYELEKQLRPRLAALLADEQTKPYFTDAERGAAESYSTSQLVYFDMPNYDNDAIAMFNEGTNALMSAISKRNFEAKKELLGLQAGMLNGN